MSPAATAVTPSASIASSLAVLRSSPTTAAPSRPATWIMWMPTPPPAPMTTTRSSGVIPASAATCTGVATASQTTVAAAAGIEPATGIALNTGSVAYGA